MTTRAMTNAEAADLLRTLKYTTAISGKTVVALDKAIEALVPNVRADIESIIEAVSRETGVTPEEMRVRGRQRENFEARAIVTWLAYHYTPMTLTAIGKRLGRDHAVTIHYNRTVDAWLDDPKRNRRGARIVKLIMEELDND